MNSNQANATHTNRLDYLDSLRGIAAISVCIQHIFGYLHHEASVEVLMPFFSFLTSGMLDWGRFGVVLFFLISGFIIPKSLRPNSSIETFLISRFFRLYPAFWLAIVLIYISDPYLSRDGGFTVNQLIANLTMVPKLFHQNYMSGVFWTLFIEILFYACCVLFFKLKLLENSVAVGIAAIGLCVITPISILANQLLQLSIPVQFISLHLSFLFLGNLLRLALVDKDKTALGFSVCFVILSIFSITVSSGVIYPVVEASKTGFVMFNYPTNIFAYALALSLFVLIIHFKNFKNKLLIGAGEISYSLYLLHMLCYVFLAQFIPLNSIANVVTFLLLSALLSYLVAKLSFTFVEYPTIQWGKQIVKSKSQMKSALN